nr:MAG TPA: protein of unknown function (DUF4373) [Caudoviricetes sp.]
MNEYGPLGQTIYDVVLCMIYHEGYYLEVPKMEQLAVKIIKTIGNRWVKKKDFVLQVIHYCAEIGLFDQDLLNQNVITSVGVQRRYKEVTVRNKVDRSKYWLIDENGQPLLNAPQNSISATEKDISATEKRQKESKVNKNIYYSNPDLNREFCLYLDMRNHTGQTLSAEQINALKEELDSLAENDSDKLGIVRKAFGGGYKSFFPTSKKRKKSTPKPKKEETIHNFTQREVKDCDYENLERQLLKKQLGDDIVYG